MEAIQNFLIGLLQFGLCLGSADIALIGILTKTNYSYVNRDL